MNVKIQIFYLTPNAFLLKEMSRMLNVRLNREKVEIF